LSEILVAIKILKSAGYVMHQQFNIQQLYALPTLYLCVFIYLRTNSDLCINWLVFITEMKSVYSAVRTVSLNKAVCALSKKGLRYYFLNEKLIYVIHIHTLKTVTQSHDRP